MAGSKKKVQRKPKTGEIPSSLLDAVVIEEVALELWHRVFVAIGYPAGTSKKALSFEKILDAVRAGNVHDAFVDVLQVIHDVGTDSGIDAMKAVADAHQYDLGEIGKHTPREAAVELWLLQRADESLRTMFTRVQMQAEARRAPRAFREYRGKAPTRLDDWDEVRARILREVEAWCQDDGLGEHVDVRGYVEGGNARIQIIHGHRVQKPLVVRDGTAGRATIQFRPVHCDIVRYDADGAWLRLSPRSTRADVVERYRRLLGQAFFGDPDFFGDDVVCSLRVLQQPDAQRVLTEASPYVLSARVRELRWERGDQQRLTITDLDCLTAVRELGLPFAEGEVIQAKIALSLIAKRTVRRTVTLRVPNQIHYQRDVYENAIEDFLLHANIRQAKFRSPDGDLWSLYPWREPATVWREAYPDDVDQLAVDHVLTPVELAAVRHPDHPKAGRALVPDSTDNEAADRFGVSENDSVPPRLLTTSDVDGFQLEIGKLIDLWREALELDGQAVDLSQGMYFLGERILNGVACAPILVARQPVESSAILGERIRGAAHGASTVLVVPAGRTTSTGLPEVQMARLIPEPAEFWRDFVLVGGLAGRVSALWTARPGARLVVDKHNQAVWLDRTPIDLPKDSHAYQFVELLAEAGGRLVTNAEIAAKLSAARADEKSVSRKAKSAAKSAFEKSLASAGRDVDVSDVLPSGRGGYRLAVPVHVS